MDAFDLIVIGSGPGGYVAAIRAAELGMKVACIEKDKVLGGTCLHVGCIPSKALLQATEHYQWLTTKAAEFGIIGSAVVDFPALMQRKEGIVKGLASGIATHFTKEKIETVYGNAQFTSPTAVAVGDRQLTAKWFIVATGSVPIALPFLPFDEKKVVSSTGALALESVPEKMVVVGGGAIGVELASVYARLGSSVQIVEMLPQIVAGFDGAVSRLLLQLLQKQGIVFHLEATVQSAKVQEQSVLLSVQQKEQTKEIEADVVLVAVGRRPYTQGLDLEKAGVKTTPKGFINVDGNLRSSNPQVMAIGDVIEGPMLAHRASHEGIALAEHLAGKTAQMQAISIPNVVYTHPEAASVGLTEEEAKAAGLSTFTGQAWFKGNGRARCEGETEGFVKLLGEKSSGRLIGLHIIGAHASELIAEGVIALDKRATVRDLAHGCFPHPTLSEVVMEAARAAL